MNTQLLERFQKADEICNRIYMARLMLNEKAILDCLDEIDRIYCSKSEYEQWELDNGGFWG